MGEKRAADTLKEHGSCLGFFLRVTKGAVRPLDQTRCVFSQ